jgi:hypothetical protein
MVTDLKAKPLGNGEKRPIHLAWKNGLACIEWDTPSWFHDQSGDPEKQAYTA